jgi:hypothetical protein
LLVLLTLAFDDALRSILQLIGIIAPIIALVTYRRNVKTKRAEWLSTLHAKFFESTTYKSMRHIIDYQPAEFATLRECLVQGGSDQLIESFVDYLNFFEFIASLWKLNQLSIEEVAMLFEYYLTNLASHQFILDFVATQGFENLSSLIAEVKRRKVVRK